MARDKTGRAGARIKWSGQPHGKAQLGYGLINVLEMADQTAKSCKERCEKRAIAYPVKVGAGGRHGWDELIRRIYLIV